MSGSQLEKTKRFILFLNLLRGAYQEGHNFWQLGTSGVAKIPKV